MKMPSREIIMEDLRKFPFPFDIWTKEKNIVYAVLRRLSTECANKEMTFEQINDAAEKLVENQWKIATHEMTTIGRSALAMRLSHIIFKSAK